MSASFKWEEIERVTVSGPIEGGPRRWRGIPSVVQLRNGNILTAYREASDHWLTPDGKIRLCRSTDSGRTWSEPETIVAAEGRSFGCHVGMIELEDGTILLPLVEIHLFTGEPPYLKYYQRLRVSTNVTLSHDGGRTWSGPQCPFTAPQVNGVQGSLKVCYLTELEPGHLVAASMWVDRQTYPGKPLFNPETEGCLPMAILLADSLDLGATWTPWRLVPMPVDIGPPSLTSPMLKLADGRLAMSIETNKHYEDASRWHQRVVLIHSTDQGQTWSDPVVAGQDPSGRIFNWDQRAGVATDGRIATFC